MTEFDVMPEFPGIWTVTDEHVIEQCEKAMPTISRYVLGVYGDWFSILIDRHRDLTKQYDELSFRLDSFDK